MIFVDTSFFRAFFSPHDEYHAQANEALSEFHGRHLPDFFITTDAVAMETITLTRSRGTHQQAVLVGHGLYNEKSARVYRTSLDQHRQAFEILRKHQDKKYSMVDCLSFLVMETLGITEVMTFDSDFSHRFTVKPGPIKR